MLLIRIDLSELSYRNKALSRSRLYGLYWRTERGGGEGAGDGPSSPPLVGFFYQCTPLMGCFALTINLCLVTIENSIIFVKLINLSYFIAL